MQNDFYGHHGGLSPEELITVVGTIDGLYGAIRRLARARLDLPRPDTYKSRISDTA